MINLSTRRTSPADQAKVYRCTCGAWAYRGRPCTACQALADRQ